MAIKSKDAMPVIVVHTLLIADRNVVKHVDQDLLLVKYDLICFNDIKNTWILPFNLLVVLRN